MPVSALLNYSLLALAAGAAGAVNSVAGGGTLLTFPALVAVGLSEIAANATSTLALVFGTGGSISGYRRELAAARRWIPWIIPSSVLGGAVGAVLLLVTPEAVFARLVPALILGATLLFVAQEPLLRWLAPRAETGPREPGAAARVGLVLLLFALAVYGGYFGAGLGILTLAVYGLLGLGTIHELNALKALSGAAINAVAAAIFVWKGLIHWPEAGVMTVASIAGGYLGAEHARRLGQRTVRRLVIAVGLVAAVATALRQM